MRSAVDTDYSRLNSQSRKYVFRPSPRGTAQTVLGVALFVGLMLWQLDRADQKRALQARFDSRLGMPAVAYRGGGLDLEKMRYRRLRLEGHFLDKDQVLLDNAVHEGRPGYQVLTPFRLRDGGVVLVDRGWVPQGARRDALPDIQVATGPLRIEGWLDRHRSRPFFGGGQPHRPGDSRWLYMDTAAYRRESGLRVPDWVIHLAPDSPQGYVRVQPHFDARVGMHIGYAIQWGAFALIAAGTWLAVSFRRRARGEAE